LLAGQGAGWGASTYSVIVDRVVGVAVLALIVIACLPWTVSLITDPVGRVALILIGFGSLGACLVFIGLGYLRLDLLDRWRLTKHLRAAAVAAAKLLRSPVVGSQVFALSVAVHLFTALAAWCRAKAGAG